MATTGDRRAPMRILVTGSRDWADGEAIRKALEPFRSPADGSLPILVHGGCPTGADALADSCARSWGWETEVYPADWSAHGRAAGPIRNQRMVDSRPDFCLAFIRNGSRGATGCVEMAERAGISVRRWFAC